MASYFHSVTLEEELCKGCTNCIKYCPTEAIRVREGKARIINERCLDCGECVRICPQHAKSVLTDSLADLKKYKYPIALPAPSLYGQFGSEVTPNHVLAGLLELGFCGVEEVAYGAEFVSWALNEFFQKEDLKKPAISSACPAVLRLIQVKFPELLNQVVPLKSPMETTAFLVRQTMEQKGYPAEDIGIFFISPCAAKVTAVKNPLGMTKSMVDGVIGISSIYSFLHTKIKALSRAPQLQKATEAGVGWAISGGESSLLLGKRRLAVDGIANVSRVLEEVAMGKLNEVDFIEGLACLGGCVGGPLTVANPFLARERMQNLIKSQPQELPKLPHLFDWQALIWEKAISPLGVLQLDEDIGLALQKMEQLEALEENLPGLDCGACGAPTCRALAEDIVRGRADEIDCLFKLREKVTDLAERMVQLSSKMPPSLEQKNE